MKQIKSLLLLLVIAMMPLQLFAAHGAEGGKLNISEIEVRQQGNGHFVSLRHYLPTSSLMKHIMGRFMRKCLTEAM